MSEFDINEEKAENIGNNSTDDSVNKDVIEETASKKKNSTFGKEFVDYVEMFVLALCFVILIFSFCFRLCTVSGPSMNDTLYEGESVIVTNLIPAKRGDIIVFHDTNHLNKPVIKRLIATEGEKVSIEATNEKMTVKITDINGNVTELDEPYIKYEFRYPSNEYIVPEGMVFVLGDNRGNSTDSRDEHVGFVDERSILGKVVIRISPISKFGIVK